MQNSFFNKNVDSSPNIRGIHKASPLLSALDEDEFSNNILNIGFIAEDSKLHFSDSSSVVSEGMSISAVSAIHANPKGSPHYISSVSEEFGTISGMEEWSSPEAPFPKRNFKRCKPEMIEDELE